MPLVLFTNKSFASIPEEKLLEIMLIVAQILRGVSVYSKDGNLCIEMLEDCSQDLVSRRIIETLQEKLTTFNIQITQFARFDFVGLSRDKKYLFDFMQVKLDEKTAAIPQLQDIISRTKTSIENLDRRMKTRRDVMAAHLDKIEKEELESKIRAIKMNYERSRPISQFDESNNLSKWNDGSERWHNPNDDDTSEHPFGGPKYNASRNPGRPPNIHVGIIESHRSYSSGQDSSIDREMMKREIEVAKSNAEVNKSFNMQQFDGRVKIEHLLQKERICKDVYDRVMKLPPSPTLPVINEMSLFLINPLEENITEHCKTQPNSDEPSSIAILFTAVKLQSHEEREIRSEVFQKDVDLIVDKIRQIKLNPPVPRTYRIEIDASNCIFKITIERFHSNDEARVHLITETRMALFELGCSYDFKVGPINTVLNLEYYKRYLASLNPPAPPAAVQKNPTASIDSSRLASTSGTTAPQVKMQVAVHVPMNYQEMDRVIKARNILSKSIEKLSATSKYGNEILQSLKAQNYNQALHQACAAGSGNIVELLIKSNQSAKLNLDFNSVSTDGNTPRIWADLSGNHDLKALLESNDGKNSFPQVMPQAPRP